MRNKSRSVFFVMFTSSCCLNCDILGVVIMNILALFLENIFFRPDMVVAELLDLKIDPPEQISFYAKM